MQIFLVLQNLLPQKCFPNHFDFHIARMFTMQVRNILLLIIYLIKHTLKKGQIKIGIMWSSSGSEEVKQHIIPTMKK